MRIYSYWPFVRPEELGLADALVARGHDVLVHAIHGRLAEDTSTRAEVRADLPAVPPRRERSLAWLASRALVYPKRSRRRAATIAATRPDVAHLVYLNYFTDWATLARLERRVPLVSTVHDVVPHEARVPRALERALLARQYAHAGTIIVHHPHVGARLQEEFGIEPSRVHHVPWPVPQVATVDRPADGDTFTLLLFGTLRRNKGLDVLLGALERLDDPGLRLVVAGRGFADVEDVARAAATSDDRVHAEIGRVSTERKDELYRAADLVVLPYTSFASQSAVLHDAYAHHRPVVVSDVGALGDAVRADGTGWVVRPGDADGLATALDGARRDAAARARATAAAAAAAAARSPAIVAEALEGVYTIAAEARTML